LVEAGFRVTAPDAPGFGNSKTLNPNAKTPKPVYFLHTFIESLEIRNPHLVGNSMGGMTISKFASDDPELFLSLTISGCDPSVETNVV
ncbi:MAG: alpha/beta hydrolase, partial [Dehalococcoidia bacterium]|nr:alpha/beta hydrolase [Dehalococcoidia bacterium]